MDNWPLLESFPTYVEILVENPNFFTRPVCI